MTSLLAAHPEPSVAELRAQTRIHLFVVASLCTGTVSTAVHIRNLSSSGALVEGLALPERGAVILLRRAALLVKGVVAWRSGNQAGLEFRSVIDVSDWLPGKSSSKQSTIDQIVFGSRIGSAVATAAPALDGVPAEPSSALGELDALRNDLLSLGEALVKDIILVATHPEIQLLDIAVQRIDRLISLAAESGMTPQQSRH